MSGVADNDIKIIDNEHQIQIGLANALVKAVEENKPVEELHEISDHLRAYSQTHFMSEELLMRLYTYPDFDDHVQDHERMLDLLESAHESLGRVSSQISVQQIEGLLAILLRHIGSRDKALHNYLAGL